MGQIVERLRSVVPSTSNRNLEIRFSVLAPTSQESAPDLGSLLIPQNPAQADVIACLRNCVREARKLSRCNLSLAKRVVLTEEFIKSFLPLAFKHIEIFSSEGGVPDPEPRQVILDTIGDMLGLLTESYKIVFHASYLGRRRFLSDSAKHIESSAFRVLELARLQQRAKGLRYQLLPSAAWLAVNNVFHAMHSAGLADTRHALLENILTADEAQKTQSIRGVFLSIHLMAKFDLLRWPVEWQAHAFAYSRWVRSLVQLVDDDSGELPQHTSISYCYDAGPAQTKRGMADTELGPALLLDWSKLMRTVTGDYLLLFDDRKPEYLKKIPDRLARLPPNERMAMAQLEMECLSDENQHTDPDDVVGTAADMRIFIGFPKVYELLRNIRGGADGVGTRLDDALARRSALLAADDKATVDSVWFLQFEDAGIIRLKTQETRFTTGLKIGSLAAYGIGNEGIAKPSFGVISRIHRSSASTLTVDIIKHGEYVCAAVVSADADALKKMSSENENVLGAIVAKSPLGEAQLLFPPVSKFRRKDRLLIKLNKSLQAITLGKMESVTRSFFLFRFKLAKES